MARISEKNPRYRPREQMSADAQKPNMGLTTWKNAPAGPVRKGDVTVAKNYLSKDEITQFDRIVTMYLDYAEDQARRHNPMHMADWIGKLDAFLRFNERGVLADPGTVSKALAEQHAHRQFERHDLPSLRLPRPTKAVRRGNNSERRC